MNFDKSNDSKQVQEWNMLLIFVTEEVSKLLISNIFNLTQLWNIPAILVTFVVLKLLTSKSNKFWHLSNINDVSVTSEVSKLEIFNFVNESQLWNIPDIFLTLEVLKLVKSKASIEEQEPNMQDISVTWEVSKSLKLMSQIFDNPKNISWQSFIGSFQINSITLFSFSNVTLKSVRFTSFPSISTWSGRLLNDSLKTFCSPFSLTFIVILEVTSRCLNFEIPIEKYAGKQQQNIKSINTFLWQYSIQITINIFIH